MADIKTREVVIGTIKTLDKSAIQAERFKNSYAKTKSRVETTTDPEEGSPAEYVSTRMEHGLELGVNNAITREIYDKRFGQYSRCKKCNKKM